MWRIQDKKGASLERFCRWCVSGTVSDPDVFWDGKPEENLADDPVTGKPRVFISKGQKAAYLKDHGLMEAGDSVHGAPVMFHREHSRKPDSRHETLMAIKKIKEMGQDVRRQEYLRIKKEGQRAIHQ
jgi:hypothetical protein